MRKIRPRSRAVKKSEESQRVLDALDAYLEGNIDKPVRWLVRFWQDQAAVMLYRELRELVIGETDPESLFDIWFQDYSKMLSEKMTPVWEQAFLEGWKNNSLFCGAEDVISSESWVRSWIVDHTGDLITNCCNEQVSAIRYLIAEAESLNMSSAETARYIRPTIGLTERQAAANLKYYNSIKEMGIPEGTLPVGWWIGFQVTDADVWEKVKDGTYSMFSIEGKAERVALRTVRGT